MVKGVSKTVIVVNDTGSKMFEKIVFYVTPEYGNLSAKQLRKASASFSFNFEDTHPCGQLRKNVQRKKAIRSLCLAVGALLFLAVGLFIIL